MVFHRFQSPRLSLKAVIYVFLLAVMPLSAIANNFTLKDWMTTPQERKAIYAKAMMEQASVHKVRFEQPAEFYQVELDNLARFSQAQGYKQFLSAPAAQSLATIAIVNCDWDNGVAPYEFALKHLGKEKLALLKGLYADAITRLENHCQ